MRAVKEVVHAEEQLKMRVAERGVSGLWRLRHSALVEPADQHIGEPFAQAVLINDHGRVRDRGRVRNGWSGGESMLLPGWHVGDGKRHFCRAGGGHRKTATFYGGKMPADGVHCVDRRTTSHQRMIRSLEVLKAHSRNNRQLSERRASAGEKEKNDAAIIRATQQRKSSLRRTP